MRVARRVHPSRVGCGATVSRRRIFAARGAWAQPADEVLQHPRISLVIAPDGEITYPDQRTGEKSEDAPRCYDALPALTSSSARGR